MRADLAVLPTSHATLSLPRTMLLSSFTGVSAEVYHHPLQMRVMLGLPPSYLMSTIYSKYQMTNFTTSYVEMAFHTSMSHHPLLSGKIYGKQTHWYMTITTCLSLPLSKAPKPQAKRIRLATPDSSTSNFYLASTLICTALLARYMLIVISIVSSQIYHT